MDSEFKLRGDFVELDDMLKVLRLVESGGDAKHRIRSGSVKVNGVVETRVRRKLRAGDAVEFGGQKITVGT
jgi:ribosome-associated protein